MKQNERMTEMERKIFNANLELVERQKILLRDISILISYIKGNKKLKTEIDNIIEYYTRKDYPTKYDK